MVNVPADNRVQTQVHALELSYAGTTSEQNRLPGYPATISVRRCYSPVLFYVVIYILIMRESIHNLVRKSRSIRRFQENRRIPDEILTELVDIARFCPSAGNRQPLRYIIS